VTLELLVDYSEPGEASGPWTDIVVWTMDDDPRIIESQRFNDPRQLRVWLKAIIEEHGQRNITVRWTDRLKRNRSLTRLLAVCLGVPVP
jgi:hypothetical protein